MGKHLLYFTFYYLVMEMNGCRVAIPSHRTNDMVYRNTTTFRHRTFAHLFTVNGNVCVCVCIYEIYTSKSGNQRICIPFREMPIYRRNIYISISVGIQKESRSIHFGAVNHYFIPTQCLSFISHSTLIWV